MNSLSAPPCDIEDITEVDAIVISVRFMVQRIEYFVLMMSCISIIIMISMLNGTASGALTNVHSVSIQ